MILYSVAYTDIKNNKACTTNFPASSPNAHYTALKKKISEILKHDKFIITRMKKLTY